MQGKKKVLLFGSGLMSEAVINYMLRRPENHVHIASNIIADAQKIAEKNGTERCSFSEIDVMDPIAVGKLVEHSDIVISYVPAFLHIHIAKVCLQHGKSLVTASYVSPQMKALDASVKQKGLIFLNELGLDPGIDHLATMKIVDEAEKEGAKIIQYESWCGGLPSPQFCDNPLGYKFTWSPIGALRALKNQAIYLENDKQITIDGNQLQYHVSQIELNQALSLEGYPNRNSVNYKQIYGLKDASKVMRGTLRYRGFCTVVCAWKQLGLLEEQKISEAHKTWIAHLSSILEGEEGETLEDKIWSRCFKKIKFYDNLSQEQKRAKWHHTIKAFKYFHMFNPQTEIWDHSKTSIQNLVNLLEKRLSLKQGETDLIAMQHIFVIEKNGHKKVKKSTMVTIGEKGGFSGMAKTVGSPTGIGAQLILDGKIKEKGVCIPKHAEIYEPVLAELDRLDIRLTETEQDL